MTGNPTPEEIAGAAFKALQAKARAQYGSNTQQLLVIYAVEAFLRRLSISEYADRMVLKGGMLMAANSIRTMTQDADLSTHGVTNDAENVGTIVASICALAPEPHDGLSFDTTTIRAEVMREDAEYAGVRCKLVAKLGQAKIPFSLDFSFGDPDNSTVIQLASVIDQPAVTMRAYPLALNLAEKIVTAMQRRATSTRDRDFADLWVTSRVHRLDARELRSHINAVAAHREQPAITLAEALADMPDRQQYYRAMVERLAYLSPPPESWTELLDGVTAFIDPLIQDADGQLREWDPGRLRWL